MFTGVCHVQKCYKILLSPIKFSNMFHVDLAISKNLLIVQNLDKYRYSNFGEFRILRLDTQNLDLGSQLPQLIFLRSSYLVLPRQTSSSIVCISFRCQHSILKKLKEIMKPKQVGQCAHSCVPCWKALQGFTIAEKLSNMFQIHLGISKGQIWIFEFRGISNS